MSENISMNKENKKSITDAPGFKFTVVKYLIIAAIAVFIGFIIQSNRQSDVSFETMKATFEPKIDSESMHDAGRKGFRRYYGLNEADYEGVLFYQSVSGMSAEEILLVKVKDQKQIQSLRESIEKRRESRINDFQAYAPAEAELMQSAELIVKGDYVVFLPTPQAVELKEAFETGLRMEQ